MINFNSSSSNCIGVCKRHHQAIVIKNLQLTKTLIDYILCNESFSRHQTIKFSTGARISPALLCDSETGYVIKACMASMFLTQLLR